MSLRKPLPRIFLGSSRESLPVLEILATELAANAEVTTWHSKKGGIFALGGFTLQSLVQSATLFDFALMVFGKDDPVIKDDELLFAPRDNVIFELGLFMSQLGIPRTLVVSPSSPKLKVLTDLHGLQLAEYDPPSAKNLTRSQLSESLRNAVAKIREHIASIGPRPPSPGSVRLGARDVFNVGDTLEALLSAQPRPEMLNLALDMEITWPLLRFRILENTSVRRIRWRSLLINPEAPAIQAAGSSSVSPDIARAKISEMRVVCEALKDDLKRRHIEFGCRAYHVPQMLHGFLVNNQSLLLSSCGIKDAKLVGAPTPYWLVSKGVDLAGDHFIGAFKGWFHHLWATGAPVWPH